MVKYPFWVQKLLHYTIQVECDRLTAVAMKQTLGRQVGEVPEHECNMHVCVGVGSHWLKLLQTILLF